MYYNDLGTKAYQKGEFQKAIDNYRLAIDYDPNFALAYGNLGLAYHKVWLTDEAIDANEKAIYLAKDNKTRASANYNMGRVYEDMEKYHTALEYYKIAQGFVSNTTYQKAIRRMEELEER
jgi:tetratricopeptide (TPR) repeat protein